MMEHSRRYHLNREDSGHGSTSDFFTKSEKRKPVRKLVTPTSSLEIVDGDQFEGASGFSDDRATPDGSFRSWSRSGVGSVPPRNDSSLSRRTLTPTKQVSLQAVRRREESSESFVDHIDVGNARHDGTPKRAWDVNDDDVDFSNLSIGNHRQTNKNNRLSGGSNQSSGGVTNKQTQNKDGDNRLASQKHRNDKDEDDSDDDSDNEGDEDKDENEKLKAPTELLMEFIDCLMKKDYPNASKLCKMILLYEPENEEALKFQPLIEEKMVLDAEAAAEEEEGSTDDDDEDDDDDDSDEDSSSDDDTSDNDDNDDVDEMSQKVPPSGKPSQDSNTSRLWKPAS